MKRESIETQKAHGQKAIDSTPSIKNAATPVHLRQRQWENGIIEFAISESQNNNHQ